MDCVVDREKERKWEQPGQAPREVLWKRVKEWKGTGPLGPWREFLNHGLYADAKDLAESKELRGRGGAGPPEKPLRSRRGSRGLRCRGHGGAYRLAGTVHLL